MAGVMLGVAVGTAIVGWGLFGTSIFNAIHIKDEAPSRAIIAYGLLVVSGATLVLGFWYLLLAQVQRIARMVDAQELEEMSATGEVCPSCRRKSTDGDRFCRHCGTSLAANRQAQ